MTQEELDKDMIESIEMWLHEIEPKWVEKELAWLDELRSRLLEEKSEKPMNQEELKEEYKDYVESDPVYSKLVNRNAGLSIARHFAQWGADHFRDTTKMVETPVSDDLEEAAESHAKTKYDLTRLLGAEMKEVEDDFIAGAEWQKEQDENEQADLFTIVALDAAQRAKEQMLKEAVECVVTTNLANKPVIYLDQLKGFQYGDKVRIIIVKEE